MSKKCPLFVAFLLFLTLQGSIAYAGPGLSKVWVKNLGDEPARVAVEYGSRGAAGLGEIVLAPGEIAAAGEANATKDARLRSGSGLLVIRSDADWSPTALTVETRPAFRLERKGDRMVSRYVPQGWVKDLAVAMGSQLVAGQTGRTKLAPGSAAALTVALLEAGSAVDVELRDAKGRVMRTFALSSTQPTRLRLDLGALGPLAGNAQVELRVLRGKVAAATRDSKDRPKPIFNKAISGTAWVSQTVNYGGTLYYYVDGGPASTCGELDTFRNGSWLYSPSWLCTDVNGDATAGPWYWSNSPSQTDEPVYIRWPNNDTTNNDVHVWDKQCANGVPDSPGGSPPTSWYGHATDTQWDAGFDFGYHAFSVFQDTSTGLYWDPFTSGYTASSQVRVPATVSRVTRWYVDWSTSFPAVGVHTTGHNYYWFTCVDDNNCAGCASYSFTR
jgi:hypothetical protein